MKSKLLFFVLLAVPDCLAYIKLKPPGYYDLCPYTNETLQQRVTLDNLEAHIAKDKWATFGCIKEIEEDYEKAVDFFVKNMTDVTLRFYAKSSGKKRLERNYPYFVSNALLGMGEQIQKYVKLLKEASQEGKLGKVKHYDKTLKQTVKEGYKLYERNLGHLENKEPCEPVINDARNKIHDGCEPGMKILEEVGKAFKKCMKGRLAQNKV